MRKRGRNKNEQKRKIEEERQSTEIGIKNGKKEDG